MGSPPCSSARERPPKEYAQDRGRQAARGLDAAQVRLFAGQALVNARDARIRAVEVALQDRLECLSLAHLGEKGLGHVRVINGDVAGAEQRAGPVLPLEHVEAYGQEAQRAARALEVGQRGPPLAHDVNQSGMERIRRGEAVAQRQPVVLGRAPRHLVACVGAAHVGNLGRVLLGDGFGWFAGDRPRKEPPAQNRQDFVTHYWLALGVDARGQVVEQPQQRRVAVGLTRAGLEAVYQHRSRRAGNLGGEGLDEVLGLAAQRGIAHRLAQHPFQVFEHLVEQDQGWHIA